MVGGLACGGTATWTSVWHCETREALQAPRDSKSNPNLSISSLTSAMIKLGETEGAEVDDSLERDMGDAMLCGVSCTDTVHGGGDAEEDDKLLQL